uniref:Uncharacterized protein n=1 Tax=Anopheles minimus TaxID=112268 RepID=A0A182WCE6_9DIPT
MKASESTVKLWSATSSPSASTDNLYTHGPEPAPGTHWVHVGGTDGARGVAPHRPAADQQQQQYPQTVGSDTTGGIRTHSASEHITLNLAGCSADLRCMKGAVNGGGGSGRPRASRSADQQQSGAAVTEAAYGVSVAPSSAAYGLTSVNSNHGVGPPGSSSASSRSRHGGYGASSYSNGSIASFNSNGTGGERSACLPVISCCYFGKMRMFVVLLAACCITLVVLAHYMDSSPITR